MFEVEATVIAILKKKLKQDIKTLLKTKEAYFK